jgi:cholesterol transport system auxiliary component
MTMTLFSTMNRKSFASRFVLALVCSALLAGCAAQRERVATATLYDLGPIPAQAVAPARNIAVSVAEVNPVAWLDTPRMFYRLLYSNDQEPRAYTQHRWVTQPAQLFGQRLKARIAQAGGVAAPAAEGAINLPIVRIEADDFTHVFESPDKSYGSISVRVSVYQSRAVVAHKSFTARALAPSNDATGGAKALAAASDTLINDIMAWLASLPLKS